jgi:hypothetical protein
MVSAQALLGSLSATFGPIRSSLLYDSMTLTANLGQIL